MPAATPPRKTRVRGIKKLASGGEIFWKAGTDSDKTIREFFLSPAGKRAGKLSGFVTYLSQGLISATYFDISGHA
jgi:hypothetical protein